MNLFLCEDSTGMASLISEGESERSGGQGNNLVNDLISIDTTGDLEPSGGIGSEGSIIIP